MPNQSGKAILVLVLLLLILGVSAYFFLRSANNKKYVQQSQELYTLQNIVEDSVSGDATKDYYSEGFKMQVRIPENASVEEKSTIIYITLPSGRLSITKNGTNFENAKDYFSDLKEKNNLSYLSYEERSINSYDSVVITDEGESNKIEKTYFIHTNNRIYGISADESLYPVLDQIVQSFEYKP